MADTGQMQDTEALARRLIDLGGAGLTVLDAQEAADHLGAGVVAVGVHRRGPRPEAPSERFDILLTTEPGAPAPWVSLTVAIFDDTVAELSRRAGQQPAAAAALVQLLRMSLRLPFEAALAAESLAFSMLLASAGFRAWRAATPRRDRPEADRPRVRLSEADGVVHLELDRPEMRNAVDARMRDELCDALGAAALFPDQPQIVLRGQGPDFCAGGDLDEFGSAADAGEAHLVRLLQSPALRLHALSSRSQARLHGACIGAGVEIPAAAGRVMAQPGARFRLPEVAMGLVPGAGGTVTLPRRIGRHRTCFMALSGVEIDLARALDWGLVDEVGA